MRYTLFSLCVFISVSFANPSLSIEELPRTGKDYALFFAVDDYRNHTDYDNLRNPIKDAKAIAKELEEVYGFDAKDNVYENPSRDKIFEVLRYWYQRSFAEDAQLFVFFSGHGEFDDFVSKGYFIPYDNNKIDLTDLGNIVTKIPCKHILLAIDACYSGTIDQAIAFKGNDRFKRPGVTIDTERQNIIEKQLRYKTRLLLTSGEKNRTPDGSNHSPFANAILKKLRSSYSYGDGLVTFTDLLGEMERISSTPYQGELIGHEQGGFVFISNSANPAPSPKFPNGHQMKLIPSGTFTMGCTSERNYCYDNAKLTQKVTLDAYWIDVHEVTNEQYARFLNEYGSDKVKSGEFKGQEMIYENGWGVKKVGSQWQAQSGYEKHPVVSVTWYGANEYAKYYGLSLPTEAQWEYAARGATDNNKYRYAGSNDINEVAWYYDNSYDKGSNHKDYGTHQVKTKKANTIGLYDMSGNVWEWCADEWQEDLAKIPKDGSPAKGNAEYRAVRGGSWYINDLICAVWVRYRDYTNDRYDDFGFRVCRY